MENLDEEYFDASDAVFISETENSAALISDKLAIIESTHNPKLSYDMLSVSSSFEDSPEFESISLDQERSSEERIIATEIIQDFNESPNAIFGLFSTNSADQELNNTEITVDVRAIYEPSHLFDPSKSFDPGFISSIPVYFPDLESASQLNENDDNVSNISFVSKEELSNYYIKDLELFKDRLKTLLQTRNDELIQHLQRRDELAIQNQACKNAIAGGLKHLKDKMRNIKLRKKDSMQRTI